MKMNICRLIFALLSAAAAPMVLSAPAKKEKQTLVLEQVLIEGEVQKQEAFFILRRPQFDFMAVSEQAMKFNLLKNLSEAVGSELFDIP